MENFLEEMLGNTNLKEISKLYEKNKRIWIAKDKSGRVWCYKTKPRQINCGGYWIDSDYYGNNVEVEKIDHISLKEWDTKIALISNDIKKIEYIKYDLEE